MEEIGGKIVAEVRNGILIKVESKKLKRLKAKQRDRKTAMAVSL